MNDNYRELETQIKNMRGEINSKMDNLGSEKVLKTVISYYSRQECDKITNNLDVMRETLQLCSNKRATLVIENNSIQKMVDELTKYMYLSFENWEQDVKYVADFVKTGFSAGGSNGFSGFKTQPLQPHNHTSKTSSVKNA